VTRVHGGLKRNLYSLKPDEITALVAAVVAVAVVLAAV
jgi:hypothetical protein